MKEFTVELAIPVCQIFNKITESGQYPRQWVTEYQTAIPKSSPPMSEDDTRNIAGTAYFSKIYESFIGDWIFPYIEPFFDPAQCGGLKKSSITHYLVKLLHFVHKYLDLSQPHAVLLVLIDLEKAFNRVSHQLVIEDLADMKVPGWLLQILISYLTGRNMFMRYRGTTSSVRHLPGSTPQGAFLGILLFLVIFNGALLRPAIPRLTEFHLKYVDDLSMLSAINLTSDLVDDPVDRLKPLCFAERFGKILRPGGAIQNNLLSLHEFTTNKMLKIKETKTCAIKFNVSKTLDFPTELEIPGFKNYISMTEQVKLLGIIISSDLKWEANTSYICNKALKKMWVLRRLKTLDVDISFLIDVYKKEVRSLLEIAVPAWHGGLTVCQSDEIERVQKTAMCIILGERLPSEEARDILGLELLSERRQKICKNFAKKTLSSKHSDMFEKNSNAKHYETRFRNQFTHSKCNTQRFYNSPINHLTRILNEC